MPPRPCARAAANSALAPMSSTPTAAIGAVAPCGTRGRRRVTASAAASTVSDAQRLITVAHSTPPSAAWSIATKKVPNASAASSASPQPAAIRTGALPPTSLAASATPAMASATPAHCTGPRSWPCARPTSSGMTPAVAPSGAITVIDPVASPR